ncbi:MAG: hypothetical protein LIP28_05995, partial [Deltaproteobacteria bacterium]|nr:hypothetical protein [Deltaproteobacteria bacterium]
MKQPLSLRVKLPLTILTAILLTFSVSTLFVLHTSKSVIAYLKSSRIQDVAHTVGHGVSMQIQRAGRDMVMAAGLPNVLEGIELPPLPDNDKKTALERASLTSLLTRARLAYGYYESF